MTSATALTALLCTAHAQQPTSSPPLVTPIDSQPRRLFVQGPQPTILIQVSGGSLLFISWPQLEEINHIELVSDPQGDAMLPEPGQQDRLVGHQSVDQTVMDYLTLEVLAESVTSDLLSLAPDVDGDGRDDLLHQDQLVLTHPGDFQVLQHPGFPDNARLLALPDVTGDGLGDLIVSEPVVWLDGGYIQYYAQSFVSLHTGSPDGYAAQPVWTLQIDGDLIEVVAVQADLDDALELFAFSGVSNTWDGSVSNGLTSVVDDIDTDAPTWTILDDHDALIGNGQDANRSGLLEIGDVDHDGYDDIIVETLGYPYAQHYLLLSGAERYRFDAPLAAFHLENTGGADYAHAVTADINGDGELDLIAASWNGSLFGGYVNVFESPLLPEPVHTGATADTGNPGSGTADSGPPPLTADTGASITAPPATSPSEPAGCGCHALGPGAGVPWLLLVPLARRRTRKPTCG